MQPSPHAKERVAQVTSTRVTSASCLHTSYMERAVLTHILPRPAEPGQPGDSTEPRQDAEGGVRRQLPGLVHRGFHRGGPAEPGGPGQRHWRHPAASVRGVPPASGGAPKTVTNAGGVHQCLMLETSSAVGEETKNKDWGCQKGSTLRCSCRQTAEKKKRKKCKRLKETN